MLNRRHADWTKKILWWTNTTKINDVLFNVASMHRVRRCLSSNSMYLCCCCWWKKALVLHSSAKRVVDALLWTQLKPHNSHQLWKPPCIHLSLAAALRQTILGRRAAPVGPKTKLKAASKTSSLSYEFSKRKVYKLLDACECNMQSVPTLQLLIWVNGNILKC